MHGAHVTAVLTDDYGKVGAIVVVVTSVKGLHNVLVVVLLIIGLFLDDSASSVIKGVYDIPNNRI